MSTELIFFGGGGIIVVMKVVETDLVVDNELDEEVEGRPPPPL